MTNWKDQPKDAIEALIASFESDCKTVGEFCAKRNLNQEGFKKRARELFPERFHAAMAAKVRKSTPYARGRAFEYRLVAYFSGRGYTTMRSPGSRGAFDVLAIKFGQQLYIQAKTNGVLSPADRTKCVTLARSVGAIPVLAERKDGQTLRFWTIEPEGCTKEFFADTKAQDADKNQGMLL